MAVSKEKKAKNVFQEKFLLTKVAKIMNIVNKDTTTTTFASVRMPEEEKYG
jgi:hypothetical protein